MEISTTKQVSFDKNMKTATLFAKRHDCVIIKENSRFLLTVTSDLLYNIITCQAVHVLYKQYYLGAV